MTQRFKPFFVHVHERVSKANIAHLCSSERNLPRGFTAKIVPGDTPRTVKVAVVFLSPKDEFVKAKGREEVEKKEMEEINARHLPTWLSEQNQKILYGFARHYTHMLKYIV